jgi:hypothetical protein
MPVADLAEEVKLIVDPQRRGRQFQASYLAKLVNTRIAGFILTRQAAPGHWGVATYALEKVEAEDIHRRHRGHRPTESIPDATRSGADDDQHFGFGPMPPMPPMPSASADEEEWELKI